MEMIAEEETINSVVNTLEKHFKLKPDINLTLQPGSALYKNKLFQQSLNETLNVLKSKLGTRVSAANYQMNKNQLYIVGFYESEDESIIKFVFPYGINIANILSNTIIKEPKKKNLKDAQIKEVLHKIYDDTVIHIVTQELFKFYMPDTKKVPSVPKDILDSITYEGLKTDDFNLVIAFSIPSDTLYPPLKDAVKKQKKDIDYNELSLAPIKSISYDPKSKNVHLVTTLH